MAGRSYTSDSRRSFFSTDDGDVDDDAFLSHPKAGSSGYMLPNHVTPQQRNIEDRRMQLLEKKRLIERSTLESSQCSLGLLHETEEIGIATAEELLKQREQLQNTEKRLDDINSTLRVSQKHIQSIKSVFGTIKNYFGNKQQSTGIPKAEDSPAPPSSVNYRDTALSWSMQNNQHNSQRQATNHPGLRVHGLTDDDDWGYVSADRSVDAQLERNLEAMSTNLTGLKGLAQGLSTEIDEQNDMITRIHDKTENADWRVQKQNKEMGKILKN